VRFFDSNPAVNVFLIPCQINKTWIIGANEKLLGNTGRLNFTLGHELGHYMLHRQSQTVFQCGEKEICGGIGQQKEREREADEFASNLLMPNNNFREQIDNQSFSFDLIKHCAEMYNVSLIAATLKWVGLTTKRAVVLLTSRNHMKWSQSSKKAFKSGFFFATRQDIIEIPQSAMAAYKNLSKQNGKGVIQPPGIWPFGEEVTKYSLYLADYKKTLTVLVFDSHSYQLALGDEDNLLPELLFPT